SECEKFNIDPEMSEAWREAELIKTGLTNLWTPFEQYNEEYESLAGQKWIVVQRKLHQLDDFVSKWEGVLEPFTSVTLVIKRELDKYSELTIALKYLRGSDFTEKHWREVFGLLGMEYVGQLLEWDPRLLAAGQDIKKQMKTLQKINSSASSEAAIRSALVELELWYEGARLTIEYYTDRAKKDTPLVRDYKELIEKVEEQQWVVAGLGGRGQAAGWEGTLADARGLLEAARRAQRRPDSEKDGSGRAGGEVGSLLRDTFRYLTRSKLRDDFQRPVLQKASLIIKQDNRVRLCVRMRHER
ncbi:putative dynein beta chain ciliary, partial [Danaus plexippus plexippus]